MYPLLVDVLLNKYSIKRVLQHHYKLAEPQNKLKNTGNPNYTYKNLHTYLEWITTKISTSRFSIPSVSLQYSYVQRDFENYNFDLNNTGPVYKQTLDSTV